MGCEIKSLLIGMLACTALVGCSNEDEPVVNNGTENGGEKAYLAVKFSMDGSSSRALGNYAEGTNAEIGVTKATFFFLDNDGMSCADPCTIAGTQLDPWTPGTSGNTNNDATTSVDETSSPVVVIKNAVKTPTQIVAVVNPIADYTTGMSLAELEAIVGTGFGVETANNFVMSNSVYMDNGKKVIATAIPKNSIKDTEEAAIATGVPVVIPVERVLAKVSFNNNNVTGSEEVDLNRENASAQENTVDITIEVNGFHLYSTNDHSYLFKRINTDWTGEWWNNASNKRSYWAESANATTWGKSAYGTPNFEDKYCQENTSADNKTKLLATAVLKADLTDDGTENPVAISLVKYRGAYYTEDGFLAEIAKLYDVTKYFVKVGDDYQPLTATQLALAYNTIANSAVQNITINGEAIQDYEAVPTLASTVSEVYTKSGDSYVPVEMATVKTALNSIATVKYWREGRTYYFTDIEHAGKGYGVTANGTEAEFGIVRNHLYRLTLSAINGLGTPAPGEKPIDPTKPEEDEESYIAAQVEILAYKVVTQSVTLE